MPSNVEIKAVIRDYERQKELAERISGSPPIAIDQEDTFYRVSQGRLKLRRFSGDQGELIYYERCDSRGPKASNYSIYPTNSPNTLNQLLTSSLGVYGVVRKKRQLYQADHTRIHLDDVEGLGLFLELEVVLQPDQTMEDGVRIAAEFMQRLEIDEQDLIQGAYVDLLTARSD